LGASASGQITKSLSGDLRNQGFGQHRMWPKLQAAKGVVVQMGACLGMGPGGSYDDDVLDGAMATVPNARWRKAICDSLESLSLETKQPA